MKRVNKERISQVLDGYMKRRNFLGMPAESNKMPLNMVSSAVNLASSLETSANGTVKCASVTDGNSNECELQFNRLVIFVKEANERHKPALMNILFPIFISVYVDMLVGGLKQTAHKFHQANRPIFNNLPIYRSTMESIMSVVQKCDKDRVLSLSKMLHSELGEIKYNVTFTPETLSYLTSYLTGGSNSMILQVFNSNITVEIATDSTLEPVSMKKGGGNTSSSTDIPGMDKLKAAIESTHDLPPSQPCMRLHTLTSQYPEIVCGHVASRHIVLGCQDSSLRLFSKNGDKLKRISNLDTSSQHKYQPDVSQVPLHGDWVEDMEERAVLNRTYDASPYLTLRGHNSEVYGLDTFDDSEYVMSCSADKTIRLWDIETACNRVIYRGHTQTIWSISTAHRSSYFASCSKDRSAKLWTTECTFPLRSYIGHTMSVDCVKFHPNNSYLATASQDRTVRLWSVQEGKCVRLMQGHKGSILCIAFSPNGSILASAGEDRKIRLWDLASGELVKELRGHTDIIRCMEFNSDGSLLCSGAQDNTIITWDTKTTPNANSLGTLGSPQAGAPPSADLLATYYTADSCIVSIQRQKYGVMEVIGVT